jgi:hypothetical protein
MHLGFSNGVVRMYGAGPLSSEVQTRKRSLGQGPALKQPVTVLQSMRTDKFGDVTVLGSQYFAVWSERNTNVRVLRVSNRELPAHLDANDRDALIEAIELWGASPASRPN